MHNKNKLDETSHILDNYMSVVPTVNMEGKMNLPNGEILDYDDTRFFSILFGGDQLTVPHVHVVQVQTDTHEKCVDRIEGLLLPVFEDWHARMTLMKVSNNKVNRNKDRKVICRYIEQ